MQLPMWHFREQVLTTIEQNQVVIVCGETGWYVGLYLYSHGPR